VDLPVRHADTAVTPHYSAHGIDLFVGDALEILPTLPINRDGAHLLLMDPPYGVRARATGRRRRQLALDRIAGDEDDSAASEIVAAAWPHLRPFRHAYVFGRYDFAGVPHATGRCELIWDKMLSTMGDYESPWASAHEYIQFALRSDGAVNKAAGGHLARVRSGSVLHCPRPNGSGARHHISEKPVPLLRTLIEMSTRPQELILDPCVGSGSTLVAALLEGRRAIGIELEVQWADIAAERLRKLTEQGNLFGFEVCDA
jgi:DNA modification methylase